MHKVRVGIIGAGGIAQVQHIPALKQFDDAEITAICDTERLKAGVVAQKFGVPHSYRLAEDLLSREEIDAVIITTPNNTHLPMALAAFQSKKHVFIERPIARTAHEAERMVKAADKAGKILMVGMNHRFRPDTLILQNLISEGQLGKIYHIRAGWMKNSAGSSKPPWVLEPRFSGGGVMMDLGVQLLDLCLWLAGSMKIKAVKAKMHFQILKAKVEDHISFAADMDDGTSIVVDAAWDIPSKHTIAYTMVFGEKGAAWLNPLRINQEMHGHMMELSPGKQYTRTELFVRSYENELKHFLECVRNNHPPISSGVENLQIMKITEAVYRSAREGKEVVFEGEI